MSHLPQRKEKNCLNCGTTVIGKYCHICGQENIEPKESVWHLISHFFNDITHFDGKFFTSMRDLIVKPGFLSKQYMIGRRASYLNPIRMYLFTSFIFFLIFFYLFKIDENTINIGINGKNIEAIDSTELKELSAQVNNGQPLTKEELKEKFDTSGITFMNANYKSKEEYDSLLRSGKKKDNWLERILTYKIIELNQKYRNNKSLAITNIVEKIQHSFPQMLFVLLPIFALLLKILYVRHKNFYYTDHAIFTIHFYIFIFFVMLLIFGLIKVEGMSGSNWISYLNLGFILGIFFYLYKAMRNFYKQRRGKTILKYILLLISFTCLFAFVFLGLVLISFFQI
ncbi:MAG: DUF3667 domain-containing protein [Bacteroidia bacterium]